MKELVQEAGHSMESPATGLGRWYGNESYQDHDWMPRSRGWRCHFLRFTAQLWDVARPRTGAVMIRQRYAQRRQVASRQNLLL